MVASSSVSEEPAGGSKLNEELCYPKSINPNCGDGQGRLTLKERMTHQGRLLDP